MAHGLTGSQVVQEALPKRDTVFHSFTLSASIKLSFWLQGDSQDIPEKHTASLTAAVDPVHKDSVSLSM